MVNSAIYLISRCDFCKQAIVLCNKPTTIAMRSACGSESS